MCCCVSHSSTFFVFFFQEYKFVSSLCVPSAVHCVPSILFILDSFASHNTHGINCPRKSIHACIDRKSYCSEFPNIFWNYQISWYKFIVRMWKLYSTPKSNSLLASNVCFDSFSRFLALSTSSWQRNWFNFFYFRILIDFKIPTRFVLNIITGLFSRFVCWKLCNTIQHICSITIHGTVKALSFENQMYYCFASSESLYFPFTY